MEKRLEPVTGIEPALPAWKAGALPLSYADVDAQGADATAPQDFPYFPGRQYKKERRTSCPGVATPGGATSRNRTDDLRVTNPLLYR